MKIKTSGTQIEFQHSSTFCKACNLVIFSVLPEGNADGTALIAAKLEGMLASGVDTAGDFVNSLADLTRDDITRLGRSVFLGIVIGLLKGATAIAKLSPEITAVEEHLPKVLACMLTKTEWEWAECTGRDSSALTTALGDYVDSRRTDVPGGTGSCEVRRYYEWMASFVKGGQTLSGLAIQFNKELAYKRIGCYTPYSLIVGMATVN